MKRFLFLLAGVAVIACSPTGGKYQISGTIDGDLDGATEVYLSNFNRVHPNRDTAILKDGKFQFKGSVTTPEYYFITVEGSDARVQFFLDNEEYTITVENGNFAEAKVTGGESFTPVYAMTSAIEEVNKKYNMQELVQEFYTQTTTDERRGEIMEINNKAMAESRAIEEQFLADNPTHPFAATKLIEQVEQLPIAEMEAKIAQFEALGTFGNNTHIADTKAALEILKKLEPGMQAPDFKLSTPEGEELALSDVYPKYKLTMIDFWAGWCGPCRSFNPTLLEYYNKYNEHGFGILGVSLDSEEKVWLDAIRDDKLSWEQVSDLQYWESAPAAAYYIRSIPSNVFVDSEGKIIKRKVGRGEMEEFIKEHLGL